MVVNKQSFQKGKLAHSMISVFLLLILTGGISISSTLFKEEMNTPKEYFILISTTLLLIACFISREGINSLFESLKSRLFLNGIVVICLLNTILGLLQYIGIIPSNHPAFHITGTFENPAGFAAVQAALFPFVLTRCFDNENGKSMLYFSVAVSTLCFVSVTLSGSRTGVLAICSSVIVVLSLTNKVACFFRTHRWLWLPIIIIATISLVLLYYVKQDSADGRVFIWSRCFDMIKERPLFGYGKHGFYGHYMDFQAEYFKTHPDSQFAMLADDVHNPFNEFIKLTIKYGLAGLTIAVVLFVLILRKIFNSERQAKTLGLSFVISLLVMCQFSYPLCYAVVWLLGTIAILPLFMQVGKVTIIPKNIRFFTSFLLILFLASTLRFMYFDMKWAEISKRALIGQVDKMLKYYDTMPSLMKRNPMFLYNYAAELYTSGHYEESLVQISKCAEVWNDYKVQLLTANIYIGLHDFENAILSSEMASDMIPCRFEPLYMKMLIYYDNNDTVNSIRVANEIIEKQIKIPSERVSSIIGHAQQILTKYD